MLEEMQTNHTIDLENLEAADGGASVRTETQTCGKNGCAVRSQSITPFQPPVQCPHCQTIWYNQTAYNEWGTPQMLYVKFLGTLH